MHIQYTLALAGLIVGFCIGLTGMGGGALMTPILVLVFGVHPSAAVSSDIVASAIMKPFGSAVHWRRGTVYGSIVGWLALGSVPAAFAGVFVDRALGDGAQLQSRLQLAMGMALLLAVTGLVVKMVLERALRRPGEADAPAPLPGEKPPVQVRPARTVALGALGGLLVGVTSVGAGSVIIVLLMLTYPRLSMRELVGTDLVQAIPLVASAAVAHALFGDLQFGLTASLLVGSIPGVVAGALVSTRASNTMLRPVLAYVLTATALKLVGVGTTPLAVVMLTLALVGLPTWAGLDAARYPEEAWRAIGRDRRTALLTLTLGIPVGFGFLAGIAYLLRLRPRLAGALARPPVPFTLPAAPTPSGVTR